jgi:hypothetical protein
LLVLPFALVPYFAFAWAPLIWVFVPWLLFLSLRYLSTTRIASRPILFFRSFSNQEADAALGRIVGPVASRFGVVRILVHKSQPGSEILGQAGLFDQPIMDRVADEVWQEHVSALLKVCRATILDTDVAASSSNDGEGLRWEMQQAKDIVGVDRVVLISKNRADSGGADRVSALTQLSFGTTRNEVESARKALRDWLRMATDAPQAAAPVTVRVGEGTA